MARTCHVLAVGGTGGQSDSCNHLAEEHDAEAQDGDNAAITGDGAIMTGYLWKKSQSASRGAAIMDGSIGDVTANVWYRRWFALKRDNCLYYYKNQDVNDLPSFIRRMAPCAYDKTWRNVSADGRT